MDPVRIWIILVGLLLFGLIAPVFAGVTLSVVNSFSDPASQIIIFLMPAAFILLWVFVKLFMQGEQRGYG